MALQNRVTPFGHIVALPGRGLMMGNRGILHDENRTVVRSWQGKRWIACVTQFRERRRIVMRPHSYTELFFLDEATALSAGHRPCAECRHVDYQRFRSLWETCFGAPANADTIDSCLHASRLAGRNKATYRESVANLPDGTYVALEGAAWLLHGSNMFAWSDHGYAGHHPKPTRLNIDVLTPRPTVAILAAGYRPHAHPSAQRIGLAF